MNRIKQLMDDRDITIEDLADYLDITESTVTEYYNGTRKPGREILWNMSRLFEVSQDYLLGKSNDMDDYGCYEEE